MMRPQFLLLLPLASMLMAWSWGAKPPEFMRDPSKTHKDFPRKTHMCGIGSSTASAAGAEKNARADMARQISSKLHGEATAVLTTSVHGKKTASSQDSVEKVVESFAAQEDLVPYMKTVYSWEPRGKYKQYMAYSCMSRADAGDAILARVAPTRAQLSKAAELAAKANIKPSVSGYAVQYASAQRAHAVLFKDWVRLRVVSPQKAQRLEFEMHKLTYLRSTAADWRRNQRISVVVDQTSGNQAAAVRGKIQQALQILDVLATGPGKSCKDPDGSTHVLTVTPANRCKRGPAVLQCQIDFEIHIEHCESSDVSAGRVENMSFSGTDNRYDEKQAQDRAWGKVTSEGLVPGLKKILGTQIPLD